MNTTVHIIPHSHWDREWYLPFEQHRMKLVELIDRTMELFAKDPSFSHFHLDGQTIVLDDYLEIKPENKALVERCVRDGTFSCGPWYILQDEFITSGEANVRNLLTGLKEAAQYGKVCKIGYFPDAFGNAGQMPQLLKQAGMEAIVFGRGVKPVGFDNKVSGGGEYDSAYSEMFWEAPDGSALPAILFANWYNNGAEIPVEEEAAKAFWEEGLQKARRFAGTGQLLFMNGCDHQPVQQNLTAAMETARKLYPEIRFVLSDFPSYVEAVLAEWDDTISTVQGELTSQETDGLVTLVNTTSSHIPLKQKNRVGEAALEKEAEPMAALAMLYGKPYPQELLAYSWKKLMQNHPHDSICGCSIDEVNREVDIRFDKSCQVANALFAESMAWMADRIDTARLAAGAAGKIHPFVVFNTTGWERSSVVTVLVDVSRCYGRNLPEEYDKMKEITLPSYVVKDADGRTVCAAVADAGTRFGYDLPKDKFRQPYMARRVSVTLEAEKIPALGYRTYYLEEEPAAAGFAEALTVEAGKRQADRPSLCRGKRAMENDVLKVEIHEDGSYSVTHKESGKCYSHIGYYEDTGDIGNEYIYVQDAGKTPILTRGKTAQIEKIEDEPYRCVYRIRHTLEVPAGADETLAKEQRRCVDIHHRTAGRSKKTVPLSITTKLILEKSAAGVKVETTIDNPAKDHRIRMVLPTGLQARTHFADSMFEVAERPNRHSRHWKNPSGCEHQQNFVALQEKEGGLLVANIGLYEYEVLPDQENAIAVTLLRCTGEMGDWGDFPTPNAQLLGVHTLSCEVIAFGADGMEQAFVKGHQFQTKPVVCQTAVHGGSLPCVHSFLQWSGTGLNLTCFKKREADGDIILRFVNETKHCVPLRLEKQDWFRDVYESNVTEERKGSIRPEQNGYQICVKPFEILTLGIVPGSREGNETAAGPIAEKE